jgi:hypothetical protein
MCLLKRKREKTSAIVEKAVAQPIRIFFNTSLIDAPLHKAIKPAKIKIELVYQTDKKMTTKAYEFSQKKFLHFIRIISSSAKRK